MARPDSGSDGRRRWPDAPGASAGMTWPLILVVASFVCAAAGLAGIVPAGWDPIDSIAGALLATAVLLLLIRHVASLAERAGEQRPDWPARSADAMPCVRDLEARQELTEIQVEMLAEALAELCEEAGVGHIADKVILRLVHGGSTSRPA